MKTVCFIKKSVTAVSTGGFVRRKLILLLLFQISFGLTSFAENLYFCSPPNPVASGPWPIDIDVNGTADLNVAVVGQNVTVLPASGNSVLVNNFSYYTNIPPYGSVLVGFPDEIESLDKGDVVPFFNPSKPFWRQNSGDSQPLTLPMTFPIGGAAATNYFAVKVHTDNDWILAWVRVRLTSAPDATCAIDWGYDPRPTPRLINEVVIGSRPSASTIRSTEKVINIPLDDNVGIDLDDDGAADIFFGGEALTTFGGGTIIPLGGGTNILGGGTNPPSSITLSYGAETTGQNELLRDSQSVWIFQTGSGVADFVPSSTFWQRGDAQLVSTGSGSTNGWNGHLAETTNGYMGIRIYQNGDFYYGWIHLQLSNQSGIGGFGPAILGWAIETRPQVPIVAGARGAVGEAVLDPPKLIGNLTVVNVTGLSSSSVVLAASEDLIHWTPLITNSVPFKFVYPTPSLGEARYFRATIEN